MAFGIPTVGLGGILTFNSKAAVAGMRMAHGAFQRLRGVGRSVQGGVQRLGGAFQSLQMTAMALGGIGIAGIGFQVRGLVREMIDLENITLSLASNLAIVKDIPVGESIAEANKHMRTMRILAVETPGEVQDVANMWNLLLEPMNRAGFEMEAINELTKSTTIAAGALNVGFQDMGNAIQKAAVSGELDKGSTAVVKLMGAAEKVGIAFDTQSFKAMTLRERIEAIQTIMSKYGEMSDQVGGTWSAMLSTLRTIRLFMFEALAGPLLEGFKDQLKGVLDFLNANFDSIQKSAREIGTRVMPFFEGMIAGIKLFVSWLGLAWARLAPVFERVKAIFQDMGLGLGLDQLGKISGVIMAIGAVLVTIAGIVLPIVVGVGMLVTALVSIGGALAEIWPVFIAIYVVIQAAAMALVAMFVGAEASGMSFGQFVLMLWTRIREAIGTVVEAGKAFGEALLPKIVNAWNMLKPAVLGVLTAVFGVIGAVWRVMGPIFAKVFEFSKKIWTGLSGLIEPLATFASTVFGVIAEVLTYLQPVITALLTAATWFWGIWLKVAGFFVDTLFPIFGVVITFLGEWWKFLWNIIKAAIEGWKIIWDWVKPLFTWIGEALMPAFVAFGKIVVKVANWIYSALGSALKFIAYIIMGILVSLSDGMEAIGMGPQFTGTIEALHKLASEPTALAKPAGMVEEPTALAKGVTEPGGVAAGKKAEHECPDINLNNKAELNVDGKHMASAEASYKTEISERSGYGITPWQQRKVLIKNLAPT
jgi:phage-related protein